MKRIHVILLGLGLIFLNVDNNYAQSANEKAIVYKTSIQKAPIAVKETLKNYSGYKISSEASYTNQNKKTVYKFKVQKGNWSHFILINQKGKVIGIETGERSSS